MKEARKYLLDKNIRPTHQRIAVMHYLMHHKTHPTAEKIYDDLSETMPTLSKMTVYNVIHTLVENKAILSLDIESKTTHFDGNTEPHAHFICTECGKIYDIFYEDNSFLDKYKPKDFEVSETQLYFKGICKECKKVK